jgi:hypothetical protein
MLALGNDFAIALDGNTLAGVAQQLNQSGSPSALRGIGALRH